MQVDLHSSILINLMALRANLIHLIGSSSGFQNEVKGVGMDDDVQESADGRFRIEIDYPHSEHFMAPEREWKLIDPTTNRVVRTFHGSENIQKTKSVRFDKTGRFLVARDGYGKTLRKIDLAELAAKLDDVEDE